MPTSKLELAPFILNLAETIEPHPRLVLDVGPGWGKYATLLREYLNYPPSVIDAVEAHEPYVEEHHLRSLYHEVINADVCDLGEWDLGYDLVLMVDVIEHMEKDRARALLDRIPGWVIICTPVEFFDNGPGLPDSETHRSHWGPNDWERGEISARADVCYHDQGSWIVRLQPREVTA